MQNVNYLGTFDSVSDLWAAYPEGGHEGDYALIGSTYYGWNKYQRAWVVTTTTGDEPVIEDDDQEEPTIAPDTEEDEEPEPESARNINYRGAYETLASAWLSMPNGGQEGDFIAIAGNQYSWDIYQRQWVITPDEDVVPIAVADLTMAAANSIDINYLGTFASIADVWAFYPEGGNTGEYVVVDDTIYSWDTLTRQWEESDNETITIAQLELSPSQYRINYLGAFDDLDDVWVAYPEGGYEGDYIHLGEEEEITVWNKWGRNWGETGDPQTPAITSQTIPGSLTINYNLTVQGHIYGTVSNADSASYAANAGKWDNHNFADYINQALRTTDNVTFNKVTAGQFVKSGGTSSQFLKADGSVDSNTYLVASDLNAYADSLSIIANTSIVLKHGSTVLSTLTKQALQDLIGTGGGGGSTVAWGEQSYDTQPLSVDGIPKDLLLATHEGRDSHLTTTQKDILALFSYNSNDRILTLGANGNNVTLVAWGNVVAGGPGGGSGPGGSGTLYQLMDVKRSAASGHTDRVARYESEDTYAQAGDLLMFDGDGHWWALEKGSDGKMLQMSSGMPSWKDAPATGIVSVSLAQGASNGTLKLIVDGTAQAEVAVKGLGSAAYTSSSNYLGINATAANSSLLENHAASYFATASDLSNHIGDNTHLTSAQRTLLDLFEYDATNHTLGIKKVNDQAISFWTYGNVTAGNNGGGGGGGGATTLGGLNNVSSDADSTHSVAKLLVKEADASHWTLRDVSSIGTVKSAVMNGTTINPDTDGVLRLGTVITAHQSLAAYRTASAQDTIDNAINAKLGNCTSTNTAADKSFVNSSIATATATFRGTSASGLTEAQFLAWANGLTHDANDYVFWNTVDSNGNTLYKRYKYTGSAWAFEYTLNNSSFTSGQWSAINSGMTSSDKTKLNGIASGAQVNVLEGVKLNGTALTITGKSVNVLAATAITVPTGLSAGSLSNGTIAISFASGYSIPTNANQTAWSNKYSKPSSGIPLTDLAQAVQDIINLFEREGSGTTADPYVIKAKYSLYSPYNISAGGNEEGGGGGGSAVWGAITGTLSNQTDLYNALSGKIDKSVLSTKGSIIYASATDTPSALAIGTTGQILKVGGNGVPVWGDAPATGVTSIGGKTGAITLGSNLSINTSNVLSCTYSYTLPIATASTLGGVKVGTNLSINTNGVLSATDTTYESKAAASGGTAVSLVTTGEKYTWNAKQNALTAGSNITISGNTISAADTHDTNSAGTGIAVSGTRGSTIGISSTYQTYISHGESAYNSLGNYLLKTGGAMSLTGVGALKLNVDSIHGVVVNRGGSGWSVIRYDTADALLGFLGFTAVNTPAYISNNAAAYTLYHSGNLTSSVIGGLGTLSNSISGTAANASKLDNTSKSAFVYATDGNTLGTYDAAGNSVDDLARTMFFRQNTGSGKIGVHIQHASNAYYAVQIFSNGYANTSGLSFRIKENGTWGTTYNLYHSGNCNNTSTAWSASSLTLNGAITGATTGSFSGDVSVSRLNITYTGGDNEITFARGNYSYLRNTTSGGRIGIITNGKSMVGDNVDFAVGPGWVSVNNGVVGAGNYNLYVNGSAYATTLTAGTRLNVYTSDATLAVYADVSSSSSYGTEAICLQTSFDGQDPTTSTYPASYPARAVLSLQPKGGNVGIGTTSPSYKLDVNGSAQATSIVFANSASSGANQTNNFRMGKFDEANGGLKMQFGSASSTNCSIQVINAAWTSCLFKIDNTGNVTATGNVSAGSDLRWKEHITDFDDTNILKALTPVEWDWKEGHGKGHASGFVAQDIQKIMPYAVGGSEEGGYVLNYNCFHALWAKSLQNHETRVEYLERRVKELESKLKQLTS